MGELTQAIKLQVFSDGGHPYWDAELHAPPVTTTRWKPEDWVKWVDQGNGTWFVKDERYHYNRKREYLLELT